MYCVMSLRRGAVHHLVISYWEGKESIWKISEKSDSVSCLRQSSIREQLDQCIRHIWNGNARSY